MNLSERVYTKRMKPDGTNFNAAAGATDVTSDLFDTAGFEGVRFTIGFGAIVANAVVSVKAQQGALANGSDLQDLAGTAQVVADDKDFKAFVIDVYRPVDRYVAVKTLRATQNATVDFILAEGYGARKEPVATDATVAGVEKFVSPDEGTA